MRHPLGSDSVLQILCPSPIRTADLPDKLDPTVDSNSCQKALNPLRAVTRIIVFCFLR